VLLPGERVPLHIFEERYRIMIGLCLDEERELGIVWLADDELKDVGCSATIAEVLERMDDGRINIVVEGTRPFRLLRRIDTLPYPAGDVELLEDDGEEPDPEVTEAAREGYADLVERVTDSRPDEEDLAGMDAYGMAATIDFAPDGKQELLEAGSAAARMELVAELFKTTMQRIDYAEKAVERARSNGKVRP